MRLFLMELLYPGAASNPNMVQQFAPNENAAAFYQPFSDSPMTRLSNSELARIRPQAQSFAASQKPFVLLKTHNLRGIHLGTPTLSSGLTAAAVYVVRNPLDVVVSYAFFRNLTMDGAIDLLLERGGFFPAHRGEVT